MKKSLSIIHLLFIGGLLITLFNIHVKAQSGRQIQEKDSKESSDKALLKVKTSEVILPVTVRNSAGAMANGLSPQDFIIIEDGVKQEISSFNRRELPINVVLLLDASDSVFNQMKQIREAAIKFIQQLRPIDQVCVIQFADKIEQIQDWTSDIDDLKHAINWRYRPGKTTHLWDAIFLAADEKLATQEGRRAIVIITDGDDTQSKISREQAYWATVKNDTSLYVISNTQAIAHKLKSNYGGLGGRIAGTKKQVDEIVHILDATEANMEEFAHKTGGRLFSPLKLEDLSQAYLLIAEELKNQYIITYTPTNDRRDGSFRGIKVILTKPGLEVLAKEGYFAAKDE